jgi:HPt (histidine-containing phosphotransfer) domain-containing protein
MPVRPLFLTTLLLAMVPGATVAQEHEHGHSQESPYTELMDREIKALSPERVEALLAGEGAGYALPAELNRYPGPRHVLDMTDALELGDDQVERLTEVFQRMQGRARVLGARLIAAERSLEAEFRDASVTLESLEEATTRVARVEAELRRTHLAAHIQTREILSPAQIERYDALRGYDAPTRR